ncbi:MAG: HD domain-containing protein [Clostridia bacterium]|nr:HD domain-containing protein [Clostridia bacterium]
MATLRNDSMNRRQANYALLISIIGAIAFYFSFQEAAPVMLNGGLPMAIELAVMVVLTALLRSIPGDFGVRRMHAGLGAALAIAMIYDAMVAVVVYQASTALTWIRDNVTGKRRSILSGSLRALLFGDGVVVLSVMVGALFYRAPTDIGAALRQLDLMAPVLLFHGLAGATSWVLFTVMEAMGRHAERRIGLHLLLLVPSVLASVLCSVSAALLMQMDGGAPIALWAALALVMLRYARMQYKKEHAQYYRVIEALSEAIEAKDSSAAGDAKRVEKAVVMIGRAMRLSRRRIAKLRIAALLRDVGKIAIDDAVLRKEGELDEREWEIVRRHPQVGHNIFDAVELPPKVRNAIMYHHERYDGNGYPEGLKLSELPIDYSILSTADAFVAMTSDRSYHAARSVLNALAVLREEAGKQFHPSVVHAFEKNAHRLQSIGNT